MQKLLRHYITIEISNLRGKPEMDDKAIIKTIRETFLSENSLKEFHQNVERYMKEKLFCKLGIFSHI